MVANQHSPATSDSNGVKSQLVRSIEPGLRVGDTDELRGGDGKRSDVTPSRRDRVEDLRRFPTVGSNHFRRSREKAF